MCINRLLFKYLVKSTINERVLSELILNSFLTLLKTKNRGGRWERGSGWGTHVHPWWMHADVWQNQYNIVK